jgi:hypothetical protein
MEGIENEAKQVPVKVRISVLILDYRIGLFEGIISSFYVKDEAISLCPPVSVPYLQQTALIFNS